MQKPKKIINIPETEISQNPFTKQDIEHASKLRVSRISRELSRGFKFIKHYPKSVSFFGSARFKEDNEHYQKARSIAEKLSHLGYAIVTGGGPGIMQAGNHGAYDAGGDSVGLNIRLPMEQVTNPYIKDSVDFYYFFTRKVTLSFSAESYIYFPGGFGTLDEFFEILTLVQTHKIPKVPIILVGNDFWNPLNEFIKKHLLEEHNAINPEDMNLYTITDDEEKILEIVKNAPMRKE
jgi:uncharacterized protein (TIGR00730 family)